jgi:hypothetical protein
MLLKQRSDYMKFGNGNIGMVTVDQKFFDLLEEPSSVGCNEGFSHAKAIDEQGQMYTIFFKDVLGSVMPWNVEGDE